MAEDKEREEGQERPSRPVTAAARRERRASAGKDADAKAGSTPRAKAADRDNATRDKAGRKPAAKSDSAEKSAERKGRATPARDRKEAKVSLFARLVRFLREVVAELRKVIWPTRKQMVTYTAVVLVFVAFMVAVVSLLDLGLGKAVFWLFG